MVVSNLKFKIECSSDGCCKLPPEIIEEIFSRLDAKSVLRLKRVCKYWLSRISDPNFMNAHHKRQVARTLLATKNNKRQRARTLLATKRLMHGHHKIHECPQEYGDRMLCSVRSSENLDQISSHVFPNDKCDMFNMDYRDMTVVGSDNGVICLLDQFTNYVYLWNPAIEKHKKLPPSPYASSQPFRPAFMLHTLYGFGYEPLNSDFKVVAACGGVSAQSPRRNFFQIGEHVSLYSLKSNSWKTMAMPDLFSSDQDYDSTDQLLTFPINHTVSVVVSGSIHWAISFNHAQLKQNTDGVVAFDLSSEEFKLIKAPSSLKNKGFYVTNISSFCGCLCLLTSPSSPSPSPSCIEIWVMKKYGVLDSWTKYLNVDLANQPVPFSLKNIFRPLGVSHNGNLLLESESRDDYLPWRLSLYDPSSNSRRVQYVCRWLPVSYFATYAESIFLS